MIQEIYSYDEYIRRAYICGLIAQHYVENESFNITATLLIKPESAIVLASQSGDRESLKIILEAIFYFKSRASKIYKSVKDTSKNLIEANEAVSKFTDPLGLKIVNSHSLDGENIRKEYGKAIFLACESDDSKTLSLLIEFDPFFEKKLFYTRYRKSRRNALMHAAAYGSLNCLKTLLEAGFDYKKRVKCDVDRKFRNGRNALDVLCENIHENINYDGKCTPKFVEEMKEKIKDLFLLWHTKIEKERKLRKNKTFEKFFFYLLKEKVSSPCIRRHILEMAGRPTKKKFGSIKTYGAFLSPKNLKNLGKSAGDSASRSKEPESSNSSSASKDYSYPAEST